MPSKVSTHTDIIEVACFPHHYFLENLAARADGSLLVTAFNRNELWYVPPSPASLPHTSAPHTPAPVPAQPITPLLMLRLAISPLSLVEIQRDVFYLFVSHNKVAPVSQMLRLDLRGWTPGRQLTPDVMLAFPAEARQLNGSCLIAPNVILVADGFANLIWRVDTAPGTPAAARVWLAHESMAYDKDGPKQGIPGVDPPGVNGVRFAPQRGYVYFTSTALKLFMRVRVDPTTLEPAGEPEFVFGGLTSDDFCIDEDAGVAYVTTHRSNTIDCVSLEPQAQGAPRQIVAGDPFDDRLIGPSSAVWGRALGDAGKVAYLTTDGGTTSPPPDGIVRPAKVLKVTFERRRAG